MKVQLQPAVILQLSDDEHKPQHPVHCLFVLQ